MTLLEPGGGEVVLDSGERTVRVLLDREEVVITASRYERGQSGPDRHIHLKHADCFWVLDGDLVFEVADETVRLGAGSFVLVPPEVVHTFRNEGPGTARFLNLHAPGCGFARHLRDDDYEFDTHDPPPDGGRPASLAVVLRPGEGEPVVVGPSRGTLKAQRGDGIDSLSLNEIELAPGFAGPPPHRHESFTDTFYVLDGTLTVRLGDDEHAVGPGSFAAAPPRTVHTFSNQGDEPARALNMMAPAGFEQYLKEVSAAIASGRTAGPELMAELAARHDFQPA